MTLSAQAGLWLAVLASGFYHGVNPAMGWPLAVSNALMTRRSSALLAALGWLGLGHGLAILAVTLPFGLLSVLLAWQHHIQTGASLLLIAAGCAMLIRHRHPRLLARIPPSRLALWSFAVAIAHGAGLMLVPIYLGLCGPEGMNDSHGAAAFLAGSNLVMALMVMAVHTGAMLMAGGGIAWAVYRWLGLGFLKRGWFNLDMAWSVSLVLVGAASLVLSGGH